MLPDQFNRIFNDPWGAMNEATKAVTFISMDYSFFFSSGVVFADASGSSTSSSE